jgi:hypothetical protein
VTIHKNAIKTVNKSLKLLCDSTEPFGGKTVVFSGNFCHILLVVKYNKYPPLYAASIKLSPLWEMISCSSLKENMILSTGNNGELNRRNRNFGEMLLKIGEGQFQTTDFGTTNLNSVPNVSFKLQQKEKTN